MKHEIKLNNRRVSVEEIGGDSVMLEFKSLDRDTYEEYHRVFMIFGVILDSKNPVRTVKVKISYDALFAIKEIAERLANGKDS